MDNKDEIIVYSTNRLFRIGYDACHYAIVEVKSDGSLVVHKMVGICKDIFVLDYQR